jgi:hypothetical protein
VTAGAGDSTALSGARALLRHGGHLVLYGLVAGLAVVAFARPELFPERGRTAWIVGALVATAFLVGWLCRGRRAGLGGWVTGGGVAAVWIVGVVLGVGLELERREVDRGQREIIASLQEAERGRELLDQELERVIVAARQYEQRLERAWARVLPLGIALAPASLAGMIGAVLGRTRRRKRRPEGAGAESPVPRGSTADAAARVDAPGSMMMARDLRLEVPTRRTPPA